MHGIDFIQDFAVVLLVAGLVGWGCQRIGLSVVVGYLVAGMVIGPFNLPVALVSDIPRIETLSQIGLVFLMFSIGMKLSLRKLRKLGSALVIATVIEAVIIYQLARLVGAAMSLTATETVFLGSMMMISSSAVIIKVLAEIGATHEKAGQMAMGIFVVEDVIAVLVLTGLGSYASIAGAHAQSATLPQTLMLLSAFVVLVGIAGVLFLPWLLKKLSLTGGAELPTLVQAGLLFILATAAQRAGFSLALGAFLLGAIVADTPHRTQIDRTFEGLRDVFSAVFFVAIGMLIDVRALLDAWIFVGVVAMLALGGRPLACATGLLLTGSPMREAVRVGLLVVPVGEFTFIIAQLGITAGVLPKSFQVVAVGAALLTTLAAPLAARNSLAIGAWCERHEPRWFGAWLHSYREWLERLRRRGAKSILWQLSKKRLIPIAVEVMLVTGLLAFSDPLLGLMREYLPPDWPFPGGPPMMFWSALCLVIVLPLIAIWRNLSVLAMLIAEVAFAGHAHAVRLQPMFELALKIFGGLLLYVWISSFLPMAGAARWVPVVLVAVVAAGVFFFRSKLIYWHSVIEVELQERLARPAASGTAPAWLMHHAKWELSLTECTIPDLADVRGHTLGELKLRTKFGCIVVGIERQGVRVPTLSHATVLYPHDRVLLLGDAAQASAGKAFLKRVSGAAPLASFDEVGMESVRLPLGSIVNGHSLANLAPNVRCGVAVVGIQRGASRILNPQGAERLEGGDDVLVLGSPEQIAAFKAWVHEESER